MGRLTAGVNVGLAVGHVAITDRGMPLGVGVLISGSPGGFLAALPRFFWTCGIGKPGRYPQSGLRARRTSSFGNTPPGSKQRHEVGPRRVSAVSAWGWCRFPRRGAFGRGSSFGINANPAFDYSGLVGEGGFSPNLARGKDGNNGPNYRADNGGGGPGKAIVTGADFIADLDVGRDWSIHFLGSQIEIDTGIPSWKRATE